MSIVKSILPVLGGLFGIGAKLFQKQPKAPVIQQPATRDDAEEIARREDELRRRKGGAADIVTGTGGAEPTVSPGKFVPGN